MVFLPHWPKINERLSIKTGLDRIQKLLSSLDNPQDKMPPIIHVAGTNGKGSTIALLKSILENAKLTVHVFTSPHIVRFNERILISGDQISDSYLYEVLEECRFFSEKHGIDISFFEAVTAAAFLAFARNNADIVLLETGLGGRLDATNIIKNNLLSIITPISLDHTQILGDTTSKIALEKAHIIKSNSKCVVSLQENSVYDVIKNYAEKQNTEIIGYEYEFGIQMHDNSKFDYKSAKENYNNMPQPSLAGYHQYINAACAIAAANEIKYKFNIKEQDIRNGISNAKWKGRLEKITDGRLWYDLCKDLETELFLDAAHNESAARSLSSWLDDQERMDTYIIIGMTRDRDVNKFLNNFKGKVRKIICVSVRTEPMNYQSTKMLQMIIDDELKSLSTSCDFMEDAMQLISEERKKNNNRNINNNSIKSRIIITGSIFLISDFLIANRTN